MFSALNNEFYRARGIWIALLPCAFASLITNGVPRSSYGVGEFIGGALAPVLIGVVVAFFRGASDSSVEKRRVRNQSIFFTAILLIPLLILGVHKKNKESVTQFDDESSITHSAGQKQAGSTEQSNSRDRLPIRDIFFDQNFVEYDTSWGIINGAVEAGYIAVDDADSHFFIKRQEAARFAAKQSKYDSFRVENGAIQERNQTWARSDDENASVLGIFMVNRTNSLLSGLLFELKQECGQSSGTAHYVVVNFKEILELNNYQLFVVQVPRNINPKTWHCGTVLEAW